MNNKSRRMSCSFSLACPTTHYEVYHTLLSQLCEAISPQVRNERIRQAEVYKSQHTWVSCKLTHLLKEAKKVVEVKGKTDYIKTCCYVVSLLLTLWDVNDNTINMSFSDGKKSIVCCLHQSHRGGWLQCPRVAGENVCVFWGGAAFVERRSGVCVKRGKEKKNWWEEGEEKMWCVICFDVEREKEIIIKWKWGESSC